MNASVSRDNPWSAPMAEDYRTAAGSRVQVSGKHRGIFTVSFDWWEERACIEATPAADVSDPADAWLRWECPCHEPGMARLERADG